MRSILTPSHLRPLAILTLALGLLGAIGCGQSGGNGAQSGTSQGNATGQAAGDSDQKQWVIGMSQSNLGEPWRVQMNADIRNAADKHPDVQVVFKDAQNDALQQRAQVEEFVNAGVDVLLISPKEAQPLTDPVARAYQAGIPVIVLDRKVLGDQYTSFIGGDNEKIGYAAGQWIKQKLNGQGNVVELEGLMTTTPGQERHAGFRDAIKGSDLNIIFVADMEWLEPNARQEMESALSRFDNIDLVFAHNDPGAHGAYLAAKAAGRAKDITFVGIDGLAQEGVAWVKQGILDATFRYPTGGGVAIDTALKILHGQDVPKEITLNSRLFTKDNAKQGGKPLIFNPDVAGGDDAQASQENSAQPAEGGKADGGHGEANRNQKQGL